MSKVQRRLLRCYPGAFHCKMACTQHHLMQELTPLFRISVGFYLVSAPLTKLDLQNNGLDEAAKTLIRDACAAKEGMSLEL